MTQVTVAVDTRGVALVTLNRPQKRNALTSQMMAALTRIAGELASDPAVRVVVLTGAGVDFCAGADLDWMRAQMVAEPQERAAQAMGLARMLQALYVLPKPLIACVQGDAFGGGVGLIAVCDLAIGREGARLGLTETRLGLIPATIGPYVVARIGVARARDPILSGRVFLAQEALALGVLDRVVSAEGLEAARAAAVKPYLAAAPGAVAAAKAMLRDLGPVIDAVAIERSVAALMARWESAEAAEGVAAFFDKRRPGWADG